LLFDSNLSAQHIYYFYAGFIFWVGNLLSVNGRVDRLTQVTSTIGESYAPIDVETPSGRWSPGSEPETPFQDEFEIVPRINRRLRRIIEEGEEVKKVTCDFS